MRCRRRADRGEPAGDDAVWHREVLRRPRSGERRGAGVRRQFLEQRQHGRPLWCMPRAGQPVADVRPQRRRQPCLPGRAVLRRPDESRQFTRRREGRRRPPLLAGEQFGLCRHDDHLDQAVGGRRPRWLRIAGAPRRAGACRCGRVALVPRQLAAVRLDGLPAAAPVLLALPLAVRGVRSVAVLRAGRHRRGVRRGQAEDQPRHAAAVALLRSPQERVPQLLGRRLQCRRGTDARGDPVVRGPGAGHEREPLVRAVQGRDALRRRRRHRRRACRDGPRGEVRVQDRDRHDRLRHQRRRARAQPGFQRRRHLGRGLGRAGPEQGQAAGHVGRQPQDP